MTYAHNVLSASRIVATPVCAVLASVGGAGTRLVAALVGVPWAAVWFLALAASASACGSLVEYIVKMRQELRAELVGAAPHATSA